MRALNSNKETRLTSFAASNLWHRRLARTQQSATSSSSKVQPRLCAELVLRPLPRTRDGQSFQDMRRVDDDCDAA